MKMLSKQVVILLTLRLDKFKKYLEKKKRKIIKNLFILISVGKHIE